MASGHVLEMDTQNLLIDIYIYMGRGGIMQRVVTFTEIGKTGGGGEAWGGEIKSLLMGISGLRCSLET